MEVQKVVEDMTKEEIISDLKAIYPSLKSVFGQKVTSFPLPTLQSGKFSKHFKIAESNVEVTSIDISAHGGYLLVGCSNGMIILFSTVIFDHRGVLVGHIHAKGLHTNLLLTVKITEDCRFCFGGVMTGSSEILAIDMGRLPVDSSFLGDVTKPNLEVNAELITVYSHFDPKLRGFGNAARVSYPKDGSSRGTYRLVCGRARLLHIWQFCPESPQQWTCMYDVSTNGNTIECIEFRNGGHEMLSKSQGANLRVWNLRHFESDTSVRPSYEDIPNSVDVKSLLGDFAFGGMYNFAVVKIGAPKEANRDAYEIPERSIQDDNGQRRKRMMRQIDDVIGTSDARHALVLCTDGGVMYFHNSEVREIAPCLAEFSSLQRDPEVERAWNLRRVGRDGDVVLLRALKVNSSSCPSGAAYTSISVYKLSDVAPDEVKSTALASTDASSWSSWGYYHDSSPVPLRMTSKDTDPSVPYTGSVFAASTYLVSKKNQNETEIIIEKVPAISVLEPSSLPPIVKSSNGDTSPLTVCTSWPPVQGQGVGQGTQRPHLGSSVMKKIGPTTTLKQSESSQVKHTPGRPPLSKTHPSSALLVKSTGVKSRPPNRDEGSDDQGDFDTPALPCPSLVRNQPTISPEASIYRLISSKTAYSGSPSTDSAFRKGLKRMRAVTSTDISNIVSGAAKSSQVLAVTPRSTATAAGMGAATSAGAAVTEAVPPVPAKEGVLIMHNAAPRIPLVEESTVVHPILLPCPPCLALIEEFNKLEMNWVDACRQLARSEAIEWSEVHRRDQSLSANSARSTPSSSSSSSSFLSLGVGALQCLGSICIQQDRLKALFVTEVCRALGDTVRRAAQKIQSSASQSSSNSLFPDWANGGPVEVRDLVTKYGSLSTAQLQRQRVEFKGAMAHDLIFQANSRQLDPTLTFRHPDMFRTAIMFDSLTQQMIQTAVGNIPAGSALPSVITSVTETLIETNMNMKMGMVMDMERESASTSDALTEAEPVHAILSA